MIRFLWLNGFIAIHTIVFCLWSILLSLFDSSGRIPHIYGAAPWARIILWVCGVKVTVGGLEKVDAKVPRIYLSNHQSYFDIFALLGFLPVNFKFILKQELMRIPLFGFTMRRAGYIGVDREDARKALKSLRVAAERLENGASLVVFPEGTRSKDGRLQSFKRGGFRLAVKSGFDVVPVAIINSRNIVPKGSLRITKGTFTMNIGSPISVAGYSKKEIEQLMERVREAMLKQMNEGPVS